VVLTIHPHLMATKFYTLISQAVQHKKFPSYSQNTTKIFIPSKYFFLSPYLLPLVSCFLDVILRLDETSRIPKLRRHRWWTETCCPYWILMGGCLGRHHRSDWGFWHQIYCIGSVDMGVSTYKAQLPSGKIIALKKLHRREAVEPTFDKSFKNEAKPINTALEHCKASWTSCTRVK
jgi:hypothetical protein